MKGEGGGGGEEGRGGREEAEGEEGEVDGGGLGIQMGPGRPRMLRAQC